jgi:hypothetical protein
VGDRVRIADGQSIGRARSDRNNGASLRQHVVHKDPPYRHLVQRHAT